MHNVNYIHLFIIFIIFHRLRRKRWISLKCLWNGFLWNTLEIPWNSHSFRQSGRYENTVRWPWRTPTFARFPSQRQSSLLIVRNCVFLSLFPVASSRDIKRAFDDFPLPPPGSACLSLLNPLIGIASSLSSLLFPSQALDQNSPSAIHPLTYPDPVARGSPHPRGAATPRSRLVIVVFVQSVHFVVSLSATCVLVVSQRSYKKIILLLPIAL